jgi:hypothetical protein
MKIFSITYTKINNLLRGAYNCLHPPFRKRGDLKLGKSPFTKGDFMSSPKQVGEKKSTIRCKLFPAPLIDVRKIE